MSMLSSLKSFFAVQQAKRWSDDERKALVRFFYDVITADGIVAADELKGIEEAAATFGVPLSDVNDLGVGWAMGVLRADPKKLKVACLIVAPAFLLDGDLDQSERAFLETISKTYGIPDAVLKDTVETLRKQKLDEALKALHDEAFSEQNAPHEDTPSEPSTHTIRDE